MGQNVNVGTQKTETYVLKGHHHLKSFLHIETKAIFGKGFFHDGFRRKRSQIRKESVPGIYGGRFGFHRIAGYRNYHQF